uniref:PPM-type phosphatase domain-containing protein n=1 Tax=Sexangularia sp. CB-2014 TaxID=1486929 RepID=A0A7S1VSM4_9EUKA
MSFSPKYVRDSRREVEKKPCVCCFSEVTSSTVFVPVKRVRVRPDGAKDIDRDEEGNSCRYDDTWESYDDLPVSCAIVGDDDRVREVLSRLLPPPLSTTVMDLLLDRLREKPTIPIRFVAQGMPLLLESAKERRQGSHLDAASAGAAVAAGAADSDVAGSPTSDSSLASSPEAVDLPLESPRSFEEQPANNSAERLEVPEKAERARDGATGGSGSSSGSTGSGFRFARKASRLFARRSSRRDMSGLAGWDGVERLCAKHYRLNAQLVEETAHAATTGDCVACIGRGTKSRAFFKINDALEVEGNDEEGVGHVAGPTPLVLPTPLADEVEGDVMYLCYQHARDNRRVYEQTLALDPAPRDGELLLDARCCLIPHPDKKKPEDAYFIGEGLRALAVADGVGGWASMGVDPAAYSTKLTRDMRLLFATRAGRSAARSKGKHLAYSLLQTAWERTQRARIQGSTTAVVCVLEEPTDPNAPGAVLSTVNLGDSGFLVLRNGNLVYASDPQQHAPNTPFQLGTDSIDTPNDGVTVRLLVLPGDLIIMGSDGVFDNLYMDQIIAIVANFGPDADVDAIAIALAKASSAVAKDDRALSPFAHYIRSTKKYPNWIGGKLDDITVVVARVARMTTEQRAKRSAELAEEHEQIDADAKLVCPVCGFRFNDEGSRQEHLRQWHPPAAIMEYDEAPIGRETEPEVSPAQEEAAAAAADAARADAAATAAAAPLVDRLFSRPTIGVPWWTVGAGAEEAFIEYTKASAALEMFENKLLKRYADARGIRTTPTTQLISTSRGVIAKKVNAPSIKSEYVLMPYHWFE